MCVELCGPNAPPIALTGLRLIEGLAEIRSLRSVSDRLDAWIAEYGPMPNKGLWQGVANELSVSREALYRELARRRKS